MEKWGSISPSQSCAHVQDELPSLALRLPSAVLFPADWLGVQSPLFGAIESGHLEAITALLSRGANPTTGRAVLAGCINMGRPSVKAATLGLAEVAEHIGAAQKKGGEFRPKKPNKPKSE